MSLNHPALLTVYIFVSKKNSWGELKETIRNLEQSGITVIIKEPEDKLFNILPKHPRIYVSLGLEWEEFQYLADLPLHERKRWLHFTCPTQIQPFKLFHAWLKFTDPLPENKKILPTRFSSETPLVSVFTASYKPKEKIKRPYRSLLNQTYSHWEWVIVDDSGDNDETYANDLLSLDDPRVRRYRQDSSNGYIGAVKRYAASLCTGEILVEVDHDDELTPDCLEKIVCAFQENPDYGFVYGDCAEVYEENKDCHWYGWDCGYGYSMYYRVWVHEMNRWQNVCKQTVINGNTIIHLMGLPNHPRAWTRDCYHQIGGHREELLVADDYDILVRTFIHTKYIAIPSLLYIQYRNKDGNNSTFHRNEQIQILCEQLKEYYHDRIYKRVKELGLLESIPYNRIWETDTNHVARKSGHIIHESTSKRSHLFPIPYSCSKTENYKLFELLEQGLKNNFENLEIVVVGRIPTQIEFFASQAPMGSIRWWPMEPTDSLETCIKYAEFCASYKEKIISLP